MTEPRTAAGRALLKWSDGRGGGSKADCAGCGHSKTHHGHFGPVADSAFGRWAWHNDDKCFVWVQPHPKRKTGMQCSCAGFRLGDDEAAPMADAIFAALPQPATGHDSSEQ
jgi:hypothetical protein